QALPVNAQFQVLAYNRRPELLPTDPGPGLLRASAQGKSMAIESLHQWRAEGGTDHVGAIRTALSLRPEVIYWLTDGTDLTTAQIESITRSNKLKVAINTIGMNSRNVPDSQPLQRLSVENRGAYRQVSSTGD